MPRWDLNVYFSDLDSPEFREAVASVSADLDEIENLFASAGIDGTSEVTGDLVTTFEDVINRWNALSSKLRFVNAFITGQVTTDSRNEKALASASEMDPILSKARRLSKTLTAWMGKLDVEDLVGKSEIAKAHHYALEKAKADSLHLMSAAEEGLVSELEMTSTVAWAKLHGNIGSQLEVEFEGEKLPMSVIRSLAYDPAQSRRKAAYEAELKAWKTVEIPLTAAMNSIKGEAGFLSKKRGWASPIDEACDSCNMDRSTLDAMMSAAHDAFPMFRRYLKAKARLLGAEQLPWYDLFAPIGEESRQWAFDEAAEFVTESFGGFSSKLADFADRTFRERWTDAEPRAGKRDGAYCMSVRGDESRILMNFKPSFGSVSTLAHELGHAYHNVCLSTRTPIQRATPMTLAETASIFCETILRNAVLKNGEPGDQLAVLEASLQGSTQVVVDITSRFLFEKWTFEKRAQRELSAREMCDLMSQSQLETYGDGLDPEYLHPYMWSAKPHYYGRSFYNFPYMFGLLFGLGLYEIYESDPETFKGRYDDLLSSTGLADAATLADGFGINIRTPEFWAGSLRQVEKDVDRFVELTS